MNIHYKVLERVKQFLPDFEESTNKLLKDPNAQRQASLEIDEQNDNKTYIELVVKGLNAHNL
jgi:hypothetical protein